MNMSTLVRGLVAYQTGRTPSFIGQELRLTPLGLVTVALEVEDLTGVRVDVDRLGAIETVDELSEFFAMALQRKRRSERRLRAA